MKLWVIGAFSGLIFSVFSGAPAEAAPKVRFEVALEEKEYKLSDPMDFTLKLHNEGKEPVTVNQRFKFGPEEAPKDQREVVLEARDSSGKPLKSKVNLYPSGLPKSDYFVRLEPGGEAVSERKWALRDFFEFNGPGSYQVTATYQNVYGKEIGLDVFRGPVTDDVTVRLVE